MTKQFPTKALSLKNPWAWAVIHAGKNIENRVWDTSFRGPIWIHVSQSESNQYYNDAAKYISQYGIEVPPKKELERGGIIGRANIVSVIPPTKTPELAWHMPDQFGFVLDNIQQVNFIPCSGNLKLWNVPEEILIKLKG